MDIRDKRKRARQQNGQQSKDSDMGNRVEQKRPSNLRVPKKTPTDPYQSKVESVGVASAQDVSPNTPPGESVG